MYTKLTIGSIIAIMIVLLSWKNMHTQSCMALIFPFILLLIISSSFISMKMQERHCYRNCYFKDSSIISKMLSSKILVTVIYLIISIVMSISIVYGVLDYSTLLWWYIVAHIIMSIFIFMTLNKILKKTIHENFLHIFTREITINISAFIFFIVYLYTAVNGYEPEYLKDNNTLVETITLATNSISSDCYYIDSLLRFKIEIDSYFWWFVNQTSISTEDKNLKAMIWIAFMIINAFAIFGINRFIVQTIYLLNLIFKKENIDEK